MSSQMSPNNNWHNLCRIMYDYLLSTSVPLIFNPLLSDKKRLEKLFNQEYYGLTMLRRDPDKVKEVWDRVLKEGVPEELLADEKEFGPVWDKIRETWEQFLKEVLVEVFKERLLGSQSDMSAYHKRSDKYLHILNEMFGKGDTEYDLYSITVTYFDMLKDYLCRNMPFLPVDICQRPVDEVMAACQEIYAARRLYHNKTEDVDRELYIAFNEMSYSSSLLTMTLEIAKDMKNHPKAQYYLVVSEYIHTLFIYVYMVEYVKFLPFVKGEPFEDTEVLKQDRYFNLFKYLGQVKFIHGYYDKVKDINREQKKRK